METTFIADTMLGKLAKWLRILGCDVEYFRAIPDRELVERAARTGRVILTRDASLVRRRKARENHLFVRGDDCRDQLRQVVEHFRIEPFARLFTRCVVCNEPLRDATGDRVRDRVPPFVFRTQESFSACPSCGRIYWNGTHLDRMVAHLKEVLPS